MNSKIFILLFLIFFWSDVAFSQKSELFKNDTSININGKGKNFSQESEFISYSEYQKLKKHKDTFSVITISLFTIFIIMFFIAGMRFKKINDKLRAKNSKIGKQRVLIEEQKNRIREKTLDLIVLNKELKENSELREALTEMIVHDMKNPISNILNLSEKNEVKWFAKQMLIMVENILDIKKYEGMLMPLNLKPVHLIRVVNEAISQVALFAHHKNIQINNRIDEKIYVVFDNEILTRVIINFLSNAIKYTPHNGEVRIENELQKNNKIVIRIIDNGIGIKEEKIPYIFDKFNQIIARKTGEARSTGIGLTFCKMAIDANNSEIIVKSIPGKFTSFEFFLEKTEKNVLNDENDITKNIVKVELPELNEDEKNYLLKFYNDLKRKDVYEIGDLKKIISKIDSQYSENILLWKEKLEETIFNCNNDLYKEIVNRIDVN